MADTPAQAALRAAFNSKLSVIQQTLTSEQQTQAQTNIGGPFLPQSGGKLAGVLEVASQTSGSPSIRLNDTDDDVFQIVVGGETFDTAIRGCALTLRKTNGTNSAVSIKLKSEDSSSALDLTSNGTFNWGGNPIIQQVSSSSSYVRFSNGLQIVYQKVRITLNGSAEVGFNFGFPVPFSEIPVVVTNLSIGNRASVIGGAEAPTTTGVGGFYTYYNKPTLKNTGNVHILAFGRWK